MSVVEGLAAYKARKAEEEARREAASKPRLNRLVLEGDGDSVVFRFAQEVDRDATHFSEKQGVGFVNIEHNHPDPKNGWKNRASCTMETQGACLPCEKVADYSVDWNGRKGWKQKEKFYINVIAGEPREVKVRVNGQDRTKSFPTDIDKETGDGSIYLLEQGTYNGIWDQLVENAVEDETILETYWKITRKGSGFNDTSYTLTKLKALPEGVKALDEFELIDIKEDVLKEVPYAQQDAFYHNGIDGAVVEAQSEPVAAAASTSTSTDDAW